jgi:hypothetical protein
MEQKEKEQEERSPFGSEYVFVRGNSISGGLDRERKLVDRLDGLNRHGNGESWTPPDSKQSSTCENGHEAVNSSCSTQISPQTLPNTPIPDIPLDQADEGSPEEVRDLDDDTTSFGALKRISYGSQRLDDDSSSSRFIS